MRFSVILTAFMTLLAPQTWAEKKEDTTSVCEGALLIQSLADLHGPFAAQADPEQLAKIDEISKMLKGVGKGGNDARIVIGALAKAAEFVTQHPHIRAGKPYLMSEREKKVLRNVVTRAAKINDELPEEMRELFEQVEYYVKHMGPKRKGKTTWYSVHREAYVDPFIPNGELYTLAILLVDQLIERGSDDLVAPVIEFLSEDEVFSLQTSPLPLSDFLVRDFHQPHPEGNTLKELRESLVEKRSSLISTISEPPYEGSERNLYDALRTRHHLRHIENEERLLEFMERFLANFREEEVDGIEEEPRPKRQTRGKQEATDAEKERYRRLRLARNVLSRAGGRRLIDIAPLLARAIRDDEKTRDFFGGDGLGHSPLYIPDFYPNGRNTSTLLADIDAEIRLLQDKKGLRDPRDVQTDRLIGALTSYAGLDRIPNRREFFETYRQDMKFDKHVQFWGATLGFEEVNEATFYANVTVDTWIDYQSDIRKTPTPENEPVGATAR